MYLNIRKQQIKASYIFPLESLLLFYKKKKNNHESQAASVNMMPQQIVLLAISALVSCPAESDICVQINNRFVEASSERSIWGKKDETYL